MVYYLQMSSMVRMMLQWCKPWFITVYYYGEISMILYHLPTGIWEV